MKTYFFYGYLLNGSGSITILSDWTFTSNDFYLTDRPLRDFHSVRYLLDRDEAGMKTVEVNARSLKDAFVLLRSAMSLNLLDFVYSHRYVCLSNGKESIRYFRSGHKSV